MILLLLSLAAADPQQTAVANPAKKAAKSPDTMICRRFAETGSLVATYKTCKTKREWDMERENLRASGPGVDSCRNSGTTGQC